MGTIVRLLPRLLLLGVAGAALLILADRAQEANAQAPAPPSVANLPPDLPPGHAPALHEQLPITSSAPPTIPVTLPAASSARSLADLPVLPAVPGLPDLPDLPDLPPLPDLPTAPRLPDLPITSSASPTPTTLADGVLGLGGAPKPAVPAATDAPFRAPSAPTDRLSPASVPSTDAGAIPAGRDIEVVAARAPPNETAPAPHPCPDGSTPHSTDGDQAGFLLSGVDDASTGAQSFDAARSCASALPRDPLLRPD
jgi:hypothetical protein